MTAFPELIAARMRGDHATTFEVTEDWLQGRTSFGGLILGLCRAGHARCRRRWVARER